MGILKLMDFIKSKFPACIQKSTGASYRNQILAIDTSNWIYQFLIKTQTIKGSIINAPTDQMGNQTGHLIGLMSRMVFCMQNNITPIWVFDGKPPEEKFGELKRRKDLKQAAQQKVDEAQEEGEVFDLLKMSQRTVRITHVQKTDAKIFCQLAGFPVIESPSEAEPQCAQIVKSGLAFATVSEDMDTLAFGCPLLIRNFHKKDDCFEVDLDKFLRDSSLTYDQFVDMCILCGCDYTGKIKNIGPVKAYSFIKKYSSIEGILEEIASNDKLANKHQVSEEFNFLRARKLFKDPEVHSLRRVDLTGSEFNEGKVAEFLKMKDFSDERIQNWLKRVNEASKFTL